MAFHFRADQFAHMAAQLQVDLRVVNVQIQRQGDRTAQGQQGCDMASSCAHMNPLSREAALFIFNQLSQAIKDNPGTAQRAEYIAQLARNAALRHAIIDRQRRRLQRYEQRDLEKELRAHLDPLL